ncbi:MAG: UTP--glucose-1-phosphate uridylyltransferase GalU [Thermodesulfovibrionales bacterium]|nr:UTP--glucose-1-phosphate uridylyltransferase GalU [Thermodesulfovibrionales bacterium]
MQKSVTKAVLPAAGLGTRFLPATKASPKEMLPIVDKPMIQYSVEEALSCGINEFIIITGKHKRTIEDHFDSAFELEENLRKKGKRDLLEKIMILNHIDFAYIRQRNPLGLGHAILCAMPFVKEEPFAVLLSDDVIDPKETLLKDMIELYKKYRSPVIALEKVPRSEVHKYGVVAFKNAGEEKGLKGRVFKITDLVEKPSPELAPSNLAIIGRYILTPDIFEHLKKLKPGKGGEIQLTDGLKSLLKEREIYGYLFNGKRYDAGSKLGFLQATVELGLKHPELARDFRKYLKGLLNIV